MLQNDGHAQLIHQRMVVRKYVPQSANPQICILTKFARFADLLQMWQFVDLQFADPIFFVTCGFADTILLAFVKFSKSAFNI
jgi:hypothetical protein